MVKNLLIVFFIIAALSFPGCTSTQTHQSMNVNKLSNEEIKAYNNDPNNTNKIVCKSETPIGSRIPERVCRFESAIENRSRQDQRDLENFQKNQGIGTVRDGG